MPNWCDNCLTIESEDKDYLQMLYNKLQADGVEFLRVLRPVPTGKTTWINWNDEGEITKTLDGEWDWDWCVTHWGTKWDIKGDVGIGDIDNETCTLVFNTAWSPPQPIIYKLQEMFPKLQIFGGYLGEGYEYAGVFE